MFDAGSFCQDSRQVLFRDEVQLTQDRAQALACALLLLERKLQLVVRDHAGTDEPISDAFNLAAISLRLGGRRLLWDSASAKITNIPEANKFLTREYRPGWEIG